MNAPDAGWPVASRSQRTRRTTLRGRHGRWWSVWLLGVVIGKGACSVDDRVLTNEAGSVTDNSSNVSSTTNDASGGASNSDTLSTSVSGSNATTDTTTGDTTTGDQTASAQSTGAGGSGTTSSTMTESTTSGAETSTSQTAMGGAANATTGSTTGGLVQCPVATPVYTCPSAPMGGADPVIAKLDGGELGPPYVDGRLGWWGMWGDAAGGTFTPEAVEDMVVSDGTEYYVELSGQGFTDWGATLALALYAPDVAGDEWGETCPYDASEYAGVRFRARGSGPPFHFTIQTEAVTDVLNGGTCQNTDEAECTGRHGAPIELTSEWQTFEVTWDMLQEPAWGCTADFDVSKLMILQWDFQAGEAFEFALDDIEFIVSG